MTVEIEITDRPIDAPAGQPETLRETAGAIVEFSGIVRAQENGTTIAALEYEAYRPMAENTMRRIVNELGAAHPCLHVHIIHRIGIVPVGEAAITVQAYAQHRAEAFAMVAGCMDRLKQDVPIWKVRALSATELGAIRS